MIPSLSLPTRRSCCCCIGIIMLQFCSALGSPSSPTVHLDVSLAMLVYHNPLFLKKIVPGWILSFCFWLVYALGGGPLLYSSDLLLSELWGPCFDVLLLFPHGDQLQTQVVQPQMDYHYTALTDGGGNLGFLGSLQCHSETRMLGYLWKQYGCFDHVCELLFPLFAILLETLCCQGGYQKDNQKDRVRLLWKQKQYYTLH